MSVTIPIMNPVRFYRNNFEPNWLTRFPTVYNQQMQKQYIEGVYPATWYKDFVINQQISVQLSTLSIIYTFEVYKYSSGSFILYDTITESEITPTGWTSANVYRYDWTPSEAGVYYFRLNGESAFSDKFIVHSYTEFTRRLVEISYRNSENDFGMIFYDYELPEISQLLYTGKTYFTGVMDFGTEIEIDVYESDRGGFEKTRATPVNTATLEIVDTPRIYAPVLNLIFSCDYLVINGIEYQNEKSIEKENIEDSDLANFTIGLREKTQNYLVI